MEKYKVLGQFDSGAYSKVYKAIHYQSNELYAIKVMRNSKEPRQKLLMHRQIHNLKNCINHPNIIHLVQVIQNGQNVFLVFEYLPMNLINYYKMIQQNEKRNLSQREIVFIFRQICLAIQYMHSKGIMHRDVKPENILINPQTLETKLIDFGFSKTHRNFQVHTDYVSTRWYRSIEIVLGLPYDFKADIFSLGALLLQLYAGYQIFRSKSNIDQLFWISKICGPPNWKQAVERINQFRVTVDLDSIPLLQSYLKKLRPQTASLVSMMLKVDPLNRPTIQQVLEHEYFQMYENVKKNTFSSQLGEKPLHLYRSPSQVVLRNDRTTKKLFLNFQSQQDRIQTKKPQRKLLNSRSNPYLQYSKNISNQMETLRFQQKNKQYQSEHMQHSDWKLKNRTEDYNQQRNDLQKYQWSAINVRNTTKSLAINNQHKQNILLKANNYKAFKENLKNVKQCQNVLNAKQNNQNLRYDYDKDKYKSLTNMFTKIKKIITVEREKQRQMINYQPNDNYKNLRCTYGELPSSRSKSRETSLNKNNPKSWNRYTVRNDAYSKQLRSGYESKYNKSNKHQVNGNAFKTKYGLNNAISIQKLRQNTFR